MQKALITGLAAIGIVGTSSVAFATNMQALDLQASQDVSGGSSQLVPTSSADLNLHSAADLDDAPTPPPAATPSPSADPSVVTPWPSESAEVETAEVGESRTETRSVNAATPATPATPAHATSSGSSATPATPASPSSRSGGEHESESHSSDHSESDDD